MAELEQTVEELAAGLLRYCVAVTGDWALAEDLAQEALTALVVRWRRQGPPDRPQAFAFTIARRRAHRALVKRRLMLPVTRLRNGHDRNPLPDAHAGDRQELERTLRAMSRLTRHERRAIELVGVGGLETAQAAAVLGITPAALKMRVHRARRRLAAVLEEER